MGKRLREARLAAQLDVPEVARRLHLDTAIIEALERDDYGRLPPPAFVRGYVRAYARLLGLPADPLIALYERSGAAQDPPLAVHTPVRVQARSGDRRVRWITYVIVVLLGALFFAWWRNESSFKFWQSPPAAAVTEGSVASPHAAASSAPAAHGPASVARQAPKPPAAASAAAPQAVLPTLPGMKLATRPRLPAPNSSSAATTASPPAAAPVPATGAHAAGRSGPAPHGTLTVRVDGECWVSIYDATGKRLVYALLLAGNARTVTGQPPFQVVLGNAPVAHVEYDGRPYDLSRFAHVRYARLKVGAAQGSGVIPGQ
ncbi:MAG: helix-turn-helix domain-containing protein [Gammaproteobacteria bacterium]|nr:helix-turn-helix domain-containing protein [Gammaproteobacteria bacterium]